MILFVCAGCAQSQDWSAQRGQLVRDLKAQGLESSRVLEAIATVPRHEFVPEAFRAYSYANRPLPIGHQQTISQPWVVAYMCQELHLKDEDRVLEIGTGSGYHAAVMSLLADTVYTIEIIPELAHRAAATLARLGYGNVVVKAGDGYRGWREHAPFDAVILTAAPPEIPQPLLDQLAVGGRLIAPVGESWQELVLVTRTKEGFKRRNLVPVMFVPMTGEAQERQ